MTKIYAYCLFDRQGTFYGVYSSLKAIHRDALKLCNKGRGDVLMSYQGDTQGATLVNLRNTLKGQCDVQVVYHAGQHRAAILKSKLKE
jgi:hypothetical protein|tara:strand:- start:1461 stop:1724 length:264 start_codon:yes stop_codon:yes gene_type:complete